MSSLLALLRTARLIFRPGIIEGSQVDLLRVQWQMRPNRRGKIIDGCVGQVTSSALAGSGASNKEKRKPWPTMQIDPEQVVAPRAHYN
jgi:hypothetical protein